MLRNQVLIKCLRNEKLETSKIGAEEKTNTSVIWRKVKISSDCFKKIDLRSSMQRTEAAIKKFHFLKLKIAILPIEHFTTHAHARTHAHTRTFTRTLSHMPPYLPMTKVLHSVKGSPI